MSRREDLSGRVFGLLEVCSFACHNKHGQTVWKCKCTCGKIIQVPSHHLKRGAVVSCRCSRRLQLTGKTFGRLTVIELAEIRRRMTYWKCRCACGNMTLVSGSALNRGRVSTCGCKKSWGKISGRYWASVRSNARNRNLVLAVTIEQAWTLFQKQKRRCALTGRRIGFSPMTASFDRIDSKKGYLTGNVQWVHRDVNRMKQEFSEAYFVKTCAEVVRYHQRPLS